MKSIKLTVFFCLFLVFNLIAQEEKKDDSKEVMEQTSDIRPAINVQPLIDIRAGMVSAGKAVVASEEKKDKETANEEVVVVEEKIGSSQEVEEQAVVVQPADEKVEEESTAETVDLSEEKIDSSQKAEEQAIVTQPAVVVQPEDEKVEEESTAETVDLSEEKIDSSQKVEEQAVVTQPAVVVQPEDEKVEEEFTAEIVDLSEEKIGSSKEIEEKAVVTQPAVVVQPEDEKVEEESTVETVDLSEEKIGVQGNWVKKREWVKESYKINEEIQTIVSEIQKLREPFQEKFRKIDGELDSFYKQEGFKHGSIKVLFNSLNRYLDKKRKKEIKKLKKGVTGEEEIKIDLLLRDVKILKREIEQLRLDIKSIDQLDRSLSNRLKKLDEHIKLALDESIRSKEMVDEIWYIIDDLKARNIYYQLKGDSLEKVKAIKRYLTGTFSNDFNNFQKIIREQIQKVSKHIKELEEKGLIIKNRSQRLEKIKLEEFESEKVVQEEPEDKKIERLADMTLGQKIYYFFVNTIATIHNFLSEL